MAVKKEISRCSLCFSYWQCSSLFLICWLWTVLLKIQKLFVYISGNLTIFKWWHTFLPPPPGSVCVRPGQPAAGSQLHWSTPPCDLYSQPYWTRWWRAERTPGERAERIQTTDTNLKDTNVLFHILFHVHTCTVLTCPIVWMEQMVESEDRRPMASVLGYSPSSRTYISSVNWAPS